MRAFVCHCGKRLEAEDEETLVSLVREHLIQEHDAIAPTYEQVIETVSTRAYTLDYAQVGYEDGIGPDEEFGPGPY
jgi:hypothetical protein